MRAISLCAVVVVCVGRSAFAISGTINNGGTSSTWGTQIALTQNPTYSNPSGSFATPVPNPIAAGASANTTGSDCWTNGCGWPDPHGTPLYVWASYYTSQTDFNQQNNIVREMLGTYAGATSYTYTMTPGGA